MARKKFKLTGTPTTRGGSPVRQLAGKEFVYVEDRLVKADGSPRLDTDREAYVYPSETDVYGWYVLGSFLAPAEPEVPTFAPGDLVLVSADAKTSAGGRVYFDGAVVATVDRVFTYGSGPDVDVRSTGGKYQTVGAQYLTKLPAGVDLAEKVARPELAFEEAIRKAAAHRDAVDGKSSTDALIELAKLLVEVAK